MASELEPYFDDDAERLAYETFCAEQERGGAAFTLDAPTLVCRWRMHAKHVPLLNRHIRALSQRRVNGAPLGHGVLSWAKQHVEWSLAEGAYAERDGVLMLVVDVNGNAAMSVGAYEPLADASRTALAARAEGARVEAAETGIAPEVLCAAAPDGRVLLGAAPDEHLCAVATLIEQLAETRGHAVERVLSNGEGASTDMALCAAMSAAGSGAAFFLVSDEHGVVPAAENAGIDGVSAADTACGVASATNSAVDSDAAAFVDFLAAGYRKLFS